MKCYVCGSENLKKLIDIRIRPEVETDYSIPEEKYFRTIYQCEYCFAYNNIHNLIDETSFYTGEYNKAIDLGKLKNRFDKIISLDPLKSDNKQRVNCIIDFLKENHQGKVNYVLDVGSGTCVFLYELTKQTNYECHCIDPDPNAVNHALKYAGVKMGHCGDIFNFKSNVNYSLITFNKVLEHTKEPVRILTRAANLLSNDGIIYIELPEGDRIVKDKAIEKRAEFAVEHFTIFNDKSISILADKANLNVLKKEVITDPSGKYSIYAFLNKQ